MFKFSDHAVVLRMEEMNHNANRNNTSKRNKWGSLVKIVGIFTMLISVMFIGKRLRSLSIDFTQFFSMNYFIFLLVASIIACGIVVAGAYALKSILIGITDKEITFSSTFFIYAKANVGKYLPGNVMHFIGRQLYARELGLSQIQMAMASFIEIVCTMATALIVSIAFAGKQLLSVLTFLYPKYNILLLLIIIVITIIICVAILFHFRNQPTSQLLLALMQTSRFWKKLAHAFIASCISFVCLAVTLLFFLQTQEVGSYLHIGLVFTASAIAWIAGFITPGVPGGLGVREVILLFILVPIYSQEAVLSAIIIQRITLVFSDVLTWILSLLWGAISMKRGLKTRNELHI